eukprot:m.69330 g.69330  ORF g.69330 m.69330 type:complete len:526 (-) comp24077_c0_seq2:277-1854(-)
MANIIHQESEYRETLRSNVAELKNTLEEICDELHETPPQISHDTNLTQLEEKLEDFVEKMTEEKEQRLEKKVELEGELERLEQALGIEIVYTPQDSISKRCMDLLQTKTDEYCQLLQTRKATHSKLVETTCSMWSDLGLIATTEIEAAIANGSTQFQYTTNNIKHLETLHDKLLPEWEEKREALATTIAAVKHLWKLLSTPAAETSAFEAKHIGYNSKCEKEWEAELEILKEQKESQLKNLVLACQTQISQIERKCHLKPGSAVTWHQQVYTEETLQQCEDELNRLKAMYNENEQIYAQLEKRTSTKASLRELNAALSDTKALSNRGGALLKQTKKRDRLNADLNKLEENLVVTIKKWEKSHKLQFLISGQTFSEMLDKEKTQLEESKARERKLRQREKAEQTEMELRYGHQPKTPRRPISDATNRTRMTTPSLRNTTQTSFQSKTKRHDSYQATPRPGRGKKDRFEYGGDSSKRRKHFHVEDEEDEENADLSPINHRASLVSELDYSQFKHGISDRGHSSRIGE